MLYIGGIFGSVRFYAMELIYRLLLFLSSCSPDPPFSDPLAKVDVRLLLKNFFLYILDCCINERLVKTFYFITFSTAQLHFDYSHILPSSVLPR